MDHREEDDDASLNPSQRDPFKTLPLEVWKNVTARLDIRDLAALASTSKAAHNIVTDDLQRLKRWNELDRQVKDLLQGLGGSSTIKKGKDKNPRKVKLRQAQASCYFWTMTFQAFKQGLGHMASSESTLKRVRDALQIAPPSTTKWSGNKAKPRPDEGPTFAELATTCATQICLTRIPVDLVCANYFEAQKPGSKKKRMEQFWQETTIFHYLYAIYFVPEGNRVEIRVHPHCVPVKLFLAEKIGVTTFCDGAGKSDRDFMLKWGSNHDGRLGKDGNHGVPGGVATANQEYYILPPKIEKFHTWGPFRLIKSKETNRNFFLFTVSEESKGLNFVYFTDSHYGDDLARKDRQEAHKARDVGHAGETGYYVLGLLELLVLYGIKSAKITPCCLPRSEALKWETAHTKAVTDELKKRARQALKLIYDELAASKEKGDLYVHVDLDLVVYLLGVPIPFLTKTFPEEYARLDALLRGNVG